MDQTFAQLYAKLKKASLDDISFLDVIRFVSLASLLKADILQSQSVLQSREVVPPTISSTIGQFLSETMGVPLENINKLWSIFGKVIWEYDAEGIAQSNCSAFAINGWEKRLTKHTLFPPNTCCLSQGCDQNQPLTETERRSVVLFTRASGAVPAHSIHLKCRTCRSNYHHDYVVQGGKRLYYDNLESTTALQAGEHQFVELDVLRMFSNLMLFSWTSGTNCARWYNHTFSGQSETPEINWPCNFMLDTDHVWDGFVLLALLEDAYVRGFHLEIPHTGLQKDRFTNAMAARNLRIIDYGQPELPHTCLNCVRIKQQPDGTFTYVDAVVTDGVTLGHPCCHIQDCQEELPTNRDEFCRTHQALKGICRVVSCGNPVRLGFKTCTNPLHIAREAAKREKGTAMFQLRARMDRLQVTHPNDSFALTTAALNPSESAEGISDETLKILDEDNCDEKSIEGNVKITARFGRRRTHNEQLIIRPCGIIIARATLYGSEAITSVKEMIIGTFRRIDLPSFLFYDNNCSLHKHLVASGDHRLDSVGKPVDVFHFKSKHSMGDITCQQYCNPASFPDLIEDQGKGEKWVFNSSIAEQTNVWFGGYHSIVREMRAVKYRFFLDQMIMMRNHVTIVKLKKDGRVPTHTVYRTYVMRCQ